MSHIFSKDWFKFESLKQHLDNKGLTDLNKLLLCDDHYFTIKGRLETQRGESKKQTSDAFQVEMEKIPEKELEKEIEKTLHEWQKIFNKVYDEWKASGVEIEREHKNETFFTFPYPSPPGFVPHKQKEKERQRRNILISAKRKFEKKQKMEKRNLRNVGKLYLLQN